MSNVKKAIKKITSPNAVIYFAVCVITVIVAVFCIGLTGAAGEEITEDGTDIYDGLLVAESLKALFMGLGIALINGGFLRGAKSIFVMPVKRENVTKILCDRIFRFSAIPFFTDVVLIPAVINKSKGLFRIFDSPVLSLALIAISAAFTFIFTWLSMLYIGIKRNGNETILVIKSGGYWMAAVIFFLLKGHIEYTVITAESLGVRGLAAYMFLALVCLVSHFAAFRRIFAEKFSF